MADPSTGLEKGYSIPALTAQIVTAYLCKHTPSDKAEIGTLIVTVGEALQQVEVMANGGPPELLSLKPPPPEPAVPIKKSVAHQFLTCLDCGAKVSMLKRHLKSQHGLTIEGYRVRWGLPPSYPMTAPAYSEVRSDMARRNKLGHR